MVRAPTERWIGPICSGWSRWSTSRASPWSQGESPSAASRVAQLRLQPQVRRVAVVPVGDQRLGPGELGGDRVEHGRVRDGPEPVRAAVEGDEVARRRPSAAASAISVAQPLGALVHQQDRLEVRLGGAHQHGAVVDRRRHHVLVRQDHPLVLVCAGPTSPIRPRTVVPSAVYS